MTALHALFRAFPAWQRLLRARILLLLVGLFFSLSAAAASYTFFLFDYPPCTGSWSSSGSTYTCSGTMTLANGDSISPSFFVGSITVVATGGITLVGNNTVGNSTRSANLQTSSGNITAAGTSTVYGNVTSTGFGTIGLTNTSVQGNVSTSGSASVTGGTITGSVAGGNGVTTNGATITSNVTAANGTVNLTGGSVGGGVSSSCCSVTTNNTNIAGGVSSTSGTVTITGGTITGTISSSGGSGVIISNATVPSGSITANNVGIKISNSNIGTSSSTVNITGNNQVTLDTSTTVYGDVTAGGWSGSLAIDNVSQVIGICTPNHPRCNVQTGSCSPPPNIPSGVGVTCYCDTFTRSNLNPSPIFGANWIVSTSDSTGILPSIANTGYLRLTNNTGNNAKAATVPGIFPAAGNYISVEFKHYAYGGGSSGADGIAVTLSDYTVPPVPGAFGGSLGYAQKSNPGSDCTKSGGCPGFAGGWLGVALDEYGNFQNPTEGRIGGSGQISQSVSLRGSGSGQSGYRFLSGTSTLNPRVDNSSSSTPSRGHYYQVVVDARNDPSSTSVAVNRDTSGNGTSYSSLVNIANVYSTAQGQGFTQSPVPANWQISFTGSTGGDSNVHEISGLRICAQAFYPPGGGTANGFNAIDEAYGTPPSVAVQNYLNGHIYMKVVGQPFKLDVAALNNNQIVTSYGGTAGKAVTLKLVDNSDGACVLDSSKNNYCSSTCTTRSAAAACTSGGNSAAACSQSLTFFSSNSGQKQSADFTVNSAFKNLVAIMVPSDGSASACSTDAFSVRPQSVSSLSYTTTLGTALTNGTTSGDPKTKAGEPFTLSATIPGITGVAAGYTGILKIENTALEMVLPATQPGVISPVVFPAATSAVSSSTATSSSFLYSEVGAFNFKGYSPASNATSLRAVYDGVHSSSECTSSAQCDVLRAATWSGVDSVSTMGDCVADSYTNSKTTDGKYGCNFGILQNYGPVGRFIPSAFQVTEVNFNSCLSSNTDIAASIFPYMDQGIPVSFRLQAINGQGGVTRNYAGTLAKLVLDAVISKLDPGAANVTPAFSALGSRLAASGFSPTTWPAVSTTSGEVALLGTLTLSSLNSPALNRVAPDGPYVDVRFGVAPVDTDGVRIVAYDLDVDGVGGNDHFWLKTKKIKDSGGSDKYVPLTVQERFGRLRLSNVYGSASTALVMPVEAQYWSGNSWVKNSDDSCTVIGTNTGSVLNNYRDQMGGTWSTTATGSNILNNGAGTITIAPPGSGKTGSVDVCLDLGSDNGTASCTAAIPLALPYLQSRWPGGSSFNNDPKATATFGIFSPEGRKGIYNRELY